MLPDRPISRDVMLKHFGYDVPSMTPRQKTEAADSVSRANGLDQFEVPGASGFRYDLDQVLRAKKSIQPLVRKAA